MLTATTDIVVTDAAALLGRLVAHFSEHGAVSACDGRGTVQLDYGSAALHAEGTRLVVEVHAADEVFLTYMKMGVAEHVRELSLGPAPFIRWRGDGADGGLPPFFRQMRLVSSHRLTPHMQRIRLAGENLARFGMGGLHVRLLLPPKGREPVWPQMLEDGRIGWAEGEDQLQSRVYTIRRIDPAAGTVDIDIVLHEGEATPGSRFATGAAPGDVVGMTGPGGGHIPAATSLLLLGDDTALPAIARILEALPRETRACAIIEVDGPADEMVIETEATAEIRYLHRLGRPPGTCALLPRALEALDFATLGNDVFVWAGCEFADFRAIRAHLRRDRKLARERHLVVAYWRRGL